jgi:RNA recognition motif-containing protein
MELDDEEEFKDILEDIREECAKFGRVMSINIPRKDQSSDINVIGNAFVEFYTLEEAKEARRVLVLKIATIRKKIQQEVCENNIFPRGKIFEEEFRSD